MKTIVNKLPVMLLAAFVLWSCQEEKLDYQNGSLDGVRELTAPTGENVTYLSNTSDVLAFEWKTVTTGAVRYEVSFSATASGPEIYRYVPTDGALRGKTSITLALLDKIASEAGILTGAQGDIYWTVYSKKGTAEVKATAAAKKLPVKRFTGFAEPPVHLYITGAATEGGADITKAQQFRNDDPNVFKVYTYLKAGEPFYFTNDNVGTGYSKYSYYTDEKIYVENGEPMTVETDGVYRITANIARNRYTTELLEDLCLYYPAGMDQDEDGLPEYSFPMTYEGGGIWQLPEFKFAFTDNRYQFRLDVAGKPRIWGSKDADASIPTVIGGSYYYIVENSVAADQYSFSYKLMSSLIGITTDIYVDMSASAPQPTHRFALSSTYDLQPVAALTAPADAASINLNVTFNLSFSWEEPQYDESLFPAKYEVVFFSDAAGETEIGTAQSDDYGLATSVTVSRSVLDNMAKAAGADIGATGNVYWSVRTLMMTESVIATAAPRKLEVKRIELPAELYISGTATENSNVANALKMQKIEDGVFQGYYSFTNNAAGYRLTTGTSGEYITYGYVDDLIIPQTGATIVASWATSATLQYRINVNLKTNKITAQVIRRVYLFQTDGGNFRLTYDANGRWYNNSFTKAAGDDRYLFRVSYTDANPATNATAWTESWCSENWDNNSAPTSTTNASFWYIKAMDPTKYVNGTTPAPKDQWGHSYKWIGGNRLQVAGASVNVYMNADNPYHKVTGTGIATPN